MTSGNYYNGDDTVVKGDDGSVEGQKIAAIDDSGTQRLAVDARITAIGAGNLPCWGSDMRYEDMNASTGGVARSTNIGSTFTDVYNVSGSGKFLGFLLTLESAFDEWEIKLIIDGNTIFTLNTMDIEDSVIYGYDRGGVDDSASHLGIAIHANTFRWQGPLGYPQQYTSTIQIQAKYIKGGTREFRAGLATRTV